MKQDDTSKKSGTNWERLRTMKDEDIDFSEIPEVTSEMFARAIARCGLRPPPPKAQLTLQLESDVLNWFTAVFMRVQPRNVRFTAADAQ
jgi:uncharacterized protein (DUF4415 family)